MKFGGSSVADAARIRRVAALVIQSAGDAPGTETGSGDAPIVVVSAMGGVTDRLFALARTAVAGRAGQAGALDAVAALRRDHDEALIALAAQGDGAEARARMDSYFAELRDIVIGVSLLGELSARSLDAITSYGEKLSVELLAVALRTAGARAAAVSAEEIVVTDDTFGNAAPDMAATTRRAVRLVEMAHAGTVPVVTGYVAATPAGVTTTLGRNGSDYSGAIIGAAVGASEVWIWTDVDGVMSADPRLVPGARSLPVLSYVETSELAYFGSKVIHPRTIVPAVAARVPIRIKNTFNPAHPGTLIGAQSAAGPGAVKAVTVIRDLALVTVEGLGMLGVLGIAARTLTAASAAGANVLMISQSSSESNIALVIGRDGAPRVLDALRAAFESELRRHDVDAISAQENMAIITVVGSEMRGTPGVAGRLFSALGRVDVSVTAIAQGSSEYSISCVVHGDSAVDALRAVHREFIEEEEDR